MKRLVAVLAVLLVLAPVAAEAGSGAAPSRPADGIDWSLNNWSAGVQMYVADPTPSDLHAHVKFKRTGGRGEREVRVGEHEKVAGTHRWGPYHFTKPARLAVGDKFIFTSTGALTCEPAKTPLGIRLDLRIKQPGKAWGPWTTWVFDDYYLLDCSEPQ